MVRKSIDLSVRAVTAVSILALFYFGVVGSIVGLDVYLAAVSIALVAIMVRMVLSNRSASTGVTIGLICGALACWCVVLFAWIGDLV